MAGDEPARGDDAGLSGSDPDGLAALLHDFRDAWGITRPAAAGEPWVASPRRSGFPVVTGATLPELRIALEVAAAAAGLDEMRAMEAEFAGWNVWRSSDGSWWASRSSGLSFEQIDAGLHATVGDVRRPVQLRALLEDQARIAEWAAGREWQVPGAEARKALGMDPEASEFSHVGAPRGAPD